MPFYAFGGSLLGTGGLLLLLMLDLWNDDSLKKGRKSRFARSGPFSHILPQLIMIIEINISVQFIG